MRLTTDLWLWTAIEDGCILNVQLTDQLVLGRQVGVIAQTHVVLIGVVDEAPAVVQDRGQHRDVGYNTPVGHREYNITVILTITLSTFNS